MRNKEHYNNRMNDYMKKRHAERRAFAIEKLGGKCCKCGSVENLEFDHIDSSLKSFSISKAMSINLEKFLKELEKCQLLCNKCHTEKTIRSFDIKPATEHGKFWMYKKFGCRCELCVSAYKETCKLYTKKYREKLKVAV